MADDPRARAPRDRRERQVAQHAGPGSRDGDVDDIRVEAARGAEQSREVHERPREIDRVEAALRGLRSPLRGVAMRDVERREFLRLENRLGEGLHAADGRGQGTDDEQAGLASGDRHAAECTSCRTQWRSLGGGGTSQTRTWPSAPTVATLRPSCENARSRTMEPAWGDQSASLRPV